MSFLATVKRTAPKLPSRVVLYAAEKFGKSSFGAYAPKPIFLMTAGETGLVSLIEAGQVPPTDHFPDDFKTFSGLKKAITELRDQPHDFKTGVVDTGNGAEILCQQAVCDESFNGEWEQFAAYGRGNEISMKEWAKFLLLLDEVRTKRGMSILILHHAKVKSFSDPAGKAWDQWKPESIEKLWGLTHKWADVIMFGGFKITVGRDDKATGESRYLHTGASAAIVGGNRYGLPQTIAAPPGAKNLWTAFAQAMAKAKANGTADTPAAKAPPVNTPPARLIATTSGGERIDMTPRAVDDQYDPDADDTEGEGNTPEEDPVNDGSPGGVKAQRDREPGEDDGQEDAEEPAHDHGNPVGEAPPASVSPPLNTLPKVTQTAVLDSLHKLELAWHDAKTKARAAEILGRPVAAGDHVSQMTTDEANKLLAAFGEAIRKKAEKAAARKEKAGAA